MGRTTVFSGLGVVLAALCLPIVAAAQAAPGGSATPPPKAAVTQPEAGARSDAPTTPEPTPEETTAPGDDWMSGLLDEPVEPEFGLRLAGTPNMFGDLPALNGGGMAVLATGPFGTATASLPLAGGSRRLKIAENNQPLTHDRVYFLFNDFHNALAGEVVGVTPARQSFVVDRYTFGVEKTFRDCLWSVEARMPLSSEMDFTTSGFSVVGGSAGNLNLVLKRMIFETECAAGAVGVGIDTPTGSEVRGYAYPTSFVVHNQAVHIQPYFGLMGLPNACWFWQGFVQVDVPTNGNRIDYSDRFSGAGTFGTLNEQTLLYADFTVGRWLYRNQCARLLTGMAALLEVHYTGTLQDTDSVGGSVYPYLTSLTFTNPANRVDIVNLTVGLHNELAANTLLRVGGVFPLTYGDNRAFDAEVQVQLERRF